MPKIKRLYKGKDHVEVEYALGPISIDDGIGKEVVTKITTEMKTNKTFYTDSSGRDFIKRLRRHPHRYQQQPGSRLLPPSRPPRSPLSCHLRPPHVREDM